MNRVESGLRSVVVVIDEEMLAQVQRAVKASIGTVIPVAGRALSAGTDLSVDASAEVSAAAVPCGDSVIRAVADEAKGQIRGQIEASVEGSRPVIEVAAEEAVESSVGAVNAVATRVIGGIRRQQ